MHSLSAEQAYMFRHALLRDAAYQLQPPTARARLHALVVRIIEQQCAHELTQEHHYALAGELAEHAKASLAAQDSAEFIVEMESRVVRFLRLAAQGARRKHDLRRASRWLEELAERPAVTRSESVQDLIAASELCHQTGNNARAWDLAQRAIDRAAGDSKLVAKARLARALALMGRADFGPAEAEYRDLFGFFAAVQDWHSLEEALRRCANTLCHRGEYSAAIELLERAEQVQHAHHCGSPADLNTSFVTAFTRTGRIDAARLRLSDALRLLEGRDADASLAVARHTNAMLHFRCGEFEQAERESRECVELARRCGAVRVAAASLTILGNVLKQKGKLDPADAAYAEAEEICRETGDRQTLAVALMNRGIVARVRSQPHRAGQFYAEAEVLAAAVGDNNTAASCLANRGSVLIDLGLHQEAQQVLESAERMFESSSDLLAKALCSGMHGMVLNTLGRHEEAVARLARAFEMLERNNTRGFDAMIVLRATWAQAEHALGRTPRARELASLAAADAARLGLAEDCPDAGVRDAIVTVKAMLADTSGANSPAP